MTNRISRRAIACALLATTALASPALAQNAGSETMPHSRQELDENGVNWATGEQINYHTDVSIGPSGPGGLRYTRAQGFLIDTSNYTMTMTGTAGVGFTVSVGQRAISFNFVGGKYVPDDGSGSTLVVNSSTQYTLTLEDGTVIVYNQVTNDSYVARAASITYPTGEKLTLAYNTVTFCTTNQDQCTSFGHAVRLQSVSSSLGYQLHYGYASDTVDTSIGAGDWENLIKVQAINTTIDPCDPLAGSCTTTQSWPTATYDTSGGVTLPDGNRWVYLNGSRQFSVKRPSAASANLVINFDANNRVSSIVRDGMTWTYSFTPGSGTMTAVRTDPLGHQETVVSSTGVGLPTSITDENGHVTTRVYTNNQLTKLTLPEGNFIQYAYDGRANLTTITRVAKPGSGLANIVTSAAYPSTCSNPATCNEPTSTTDARGAETDFAYNADGTLQSVTLPAPASGAVRPQTRYAYTNITTPGGTVVSRLQSISQCQTTASCTGTADETKTSLSWSNQLLPTGITQANGAGTLSAATTITNDDVGNVKTVDGPLAGTADTTTLHYDLMRRLAGASSPDPDGAGPLKMRAIRLTFNSDGNVSKVERGTVNSASDADWAAMSVLETASVGYDSAARPVTESLAGPDGVTQTLTQLSYDGEGRLQCEAVRMNPAAFAMLPADACTPGTAGSFGPDRIAKNVYDSADQLTQVQEGVGTADAANERTLAYNPNGTVASLTDGENNKTSYVYDGFDRLSLTQYPRAAKGAGTSDASDFEQLSYDSNGNVVTRRVRSGASIGYSYDNLNRLTHKGGSALADRDYTYDNLGRMLTATFSSSGQGVTNTFDALGRLTSTSSTMGGTAHPLTYQYDLAGNRTQMSWWDGFFVDYDRLVTGEISKVREDGAASGVGVLASYSYDNLGNRTGAAFGNGTSVSYGYDPVSRLASLSDDLAGTNGDLTKTYAYNPASQIVSQTSSNDSYAWTGHFNENTATATNGLNELTSVGSTSAGYDSNGNLNAFGADTRTYSVENELVQAHVAGVSTDLSYDPLNRLDTYSTGTPLRFVHDGGGAVVAELGSSGGIAHRYVRTDDPDELLVVYSDASTASHRWVTNDERDSVLAQADASGVMQALNRYDEYGAPAAGNTGRFGYTGQMWLTEAGVYNYKARMYAPTLGRFLQTDPVGPVDSPNLYAYVLNDPVNLVDPTGLDVWCGGVYATVCGHRIHDTNFENRDNSLRSPGERNGRDGRENKDKKQKKIQCPARPNLLPHGAAVVGNINVSAGIGAGAIFDETVGLGLFGRSAGAFVSGVAGLLGGARVPSAANPRQTTEGPHGVAGVFGSLGAGILVTNATDASQLRGPFDTFTLNVPIGAVSISHGGGIWSVGVTAGPGLIASTSRATTNTKTLGGC